MNRDKQEMALWRRVFEHWYRRELYEIDTCGNVADVAVAEFRKRYPVEPTAPPAVWYDEPPFAKDGKSYPCWVDGWGLNHTTAVAEVYWYDDDWHMQIVGCPRQYLLAGRRVCPIVKPPEPTT